MNSHLIETGYILDARTNVWSRHDYSGIAYSDGDEVEQRIASIINDATDLSVLSSELRQHCTDWPSLYHLSGTRANILRPFEANLRGDILEIGAGCGAITRYLGECGGNVLALEGSQRRAAIARSRTRELLNVTVVSDKFDQFQSDRKFDVITLIGVFEYANLFTSGDNPALTMLERVCTLLKPDGKLIIAIENQLGLKYFAGAPEDHLGKPMYGIEDLYRKNEPQTYGRKVLADLLDQAGFTSSEFLAPFPDYKLPVAIITEEGMAAREFDAAALASQCVKRDPQLPERTLFSLERTWPSIFRNGLAIDLSNSYLIAASPSQSSILLHSGNLAFHYSTDRKSLFCKETAFVRTAQEKIMVKCRTLLARAESDVSSDQALTFKCPVDSAYFHAVPLGRQFLDIVTRPGWSIGEIQSYFERYLKIVLKIASNEGHNFHSEVQNIVLPGEYLDAIPFNVLVDKNGDAIYIDREWSSSEGVPLDYLMFRAIVSLLDSVSLFSVPQDLSYITRGKIVLSVMKNLGFAPTEEDFSRFLRLESNLSVFSSGIESRSFSTWSPDQTLAGLSTSSSIEVLESRISETMAAKQYAEELAYTRLADLNAIQAELAEIKCSWRFRLLKALGLFPKRKGPNV